MHVPLEPSHLPTWDEIGPQIVISALNAVFLALLVGLSANLILRAFENRQTRRELCQTTSIEMWHVAYAFYWKSQEQIWRKQYHQKVDAVKLAHDYESFRIEARVLEAKLDANFPGNASWLWHGAVDMLGVRYYRLTQPKKRLNDMIASHGGHPDDASRITDPKVRALFLRKEQLQDDVLVKKTFEEMLLAAVNSVRAEANKLDPIHL